MYSLRNQVLHQGTPNIEKETIKEDRNKIDRFILLKEPKNEFDIYSDTSSYTKDGWWMYQKDIKRTYSVSIRRLCLIICWTAEVYYKDNKDKFDFFDYILLDKGHEYDDIFSVKSKG